MKSLRWSAAPLEATPIQRKNFLNVQIDAIGIGMASAAATFLPVFFTRLGASNVEVGLLTSMPALTGLILAIPLGRFLQSRRQIVPWFSAGRLLVISAYALTGLVTIVVPPQFAVVAVLAIWALATMPQVVVNITWSLVMNGVAGPENHERLHGLAPLLIGRRHDGPDHRQYQHSIGFHGHDTAPAFSRSGAGGGDGGGAEVECAGGRHVGLRGERGAFVGRRRWAPAGFEDDCAERRRRLATAQKRERPGGRSNDVRARAPGRKPARAWAHRPVSPAAASRLEQSPRR